MLAVVVGLILTILLIVQLARPHVQIQTAGSVRQQQRATDLSNCQQPYLDEQKTAQVQAEDPYLSRQADVALANAADGLRVCMAQYGD